MASDYGKKVARAASTGGGATSRGQRSWGWYFALLLIFALGVPLVWLSRSQHIVDEHPDGNDHWHVAIGYYVCDHFLPDMADDFAATGAPLHTHGDGLIHIEPNVVTPDSSGNVNQAFADAVGTAVTLGKYVQFSEPVGLSMTKTSFQLPNDTAHKNGDKCNGKPAAVKFQVWPTEKTVTPEVLTANPLGVRLKNDMLITVGLVPAGVTMPKPPSEAALASVQGLANGQHVAGVTTPTSATTPTTAAKK